MAIHIVEEANRCLGCKRAFCQLKGCPVQTPIPQVIDLFKQRRLEEAGELLFQNNPMSAVCSMICNHSGQCEGACIQGRKGTPVHFSSIENYISTAYLDRKEWKPAPSCGKQVAVVGSGPAGITVAIKMAQLGCAVTVFEQRPEIGGVLEYGIPEFRLPRSLVQKYRHVMCSLGVRVRPSTTIGGALHIDDLLRDGYDAVFVGTGTWRARKLGIPASRVATCCLVSIIWSILRAWQLGRTWRLSAPATWPWMLPAQPCARALARSPCMPDRAISLPSMMRWS